MPLAILKIETYNMLEKHKKIVLSIPEKEGKKMTRELYAVCPKCGKRARIQSHRWDWEREEDMVLVKCTCGRAEMPYRESNILPVDINNPYLKENNFDLLIPPAWAADRYNLWNKIGKCLMATW